MCWVNKPLMEQLAIRLGYQPKSFWPGTRKTIAKSLVMSQVEGIVRKLSCATRPCSCRISVSPNLRTGKAGTR